MFYVTFLAFNNHNNHNSDWTLINIITFQYYYIESYIIVY